MTQKQHSAKEAVDSKEIFQSDRDGRGDYVGLASYGGVSHPVWTDGHFQLNPLSGCRTNLAMEEVFTSTVSQKKAGK